MVVNTTFSLALTGVVPAACDAEAGQADSLATDVPPSVFALERGFAEQSRLTRLCRWIAGESPRAWSRARIGATCESN